MRTVKSYEEKLEARERRRGGRRREKERKRTVTEGRRLIQLGEFGTDTKDIWPSEKRELVRKTYIYPFAPMFSSVGNRIRHRQEPGHLRQKVFFLFFLFERTGTWLVFCPGRILYICNIVFPEPEEEEVRGCLFKEEDVVALCAAKNGRIRRWKLLVSLSSPQLSLSL